MTPCGAEPSPSGISVVLPRLRVEPAELAGVLGRVPDRPVGCDRHVVRVRARGDGVLLDAQAGRRGRGGPAERPPLARQHAADDPEAARAERPEDDRLALLERLPVVSWTTTLCVTSTVSFPGAGFVPSSRRAFLICVRQAASCSAAMVLRSAGWTVARPNASRAVSSVRQYDAREDLADGKAEAPHAATDRARVGPSLGGEVPLGRAVGDDDGILVGLREVGRRVPEDEDEPAGAQLAVRSWSGAAAAPATSVTASAATKAPTSEREDGTCSSFADDPVHGSRVAAATSGAEVRLGFERDRPRPRGAEPGRCRNRGVE